MSEAEQLPVGRQLRAAVAPRLDAYEIRRLLLVAGCIAVAAAANYAHSVLPQRAPVAVGSAVLGILLVLRRRPRRPDPVADDAVEVEPELDPVESPVSAPLVRGRRGANQAMQALAASVAMLERQLEAHEKRLTSLSGRQSLLQVESREKLAEFELRLSGVEARLTEMENQTERIRGHHLDLLRGLNASVAEHRQSLVELVEPKDP